MEEKMVAELKMVVVKELEERLMKVEKKRVVELKEWTRRWRRKEW